MLSSALKIGLVLRRPTGDHIGPSLELVSLRDRAVILQAGKGKIDLKGTPFAITSDAYVWLDGNKKAASSEGRQIVELGCSGTCT